ncbi:MAG TPA: hypothetical protein VFS30_13295 [Dehalococcoidia bacterium]|nr:hypothetical protein [Dehalococcoidia bacterium]
MTTPTTSLSLILIALGAVLSFAVSFQVVGIDIVAIGAILMIVGAIGLAISLLTLAGYAPWNANTSAGRANQVGVVAPQAATATPTQPAAPAAQTPTNSPQASVVVVGAPAPGAVPSPAAAPATPTAPAAEVAPGG